MGKIPEKSIVRRQEDEGGKQEVNQRLELLNQQK
jgi:hypothetical protein